MFLTDVFTVRVYAYGVMSNHCHIALEYRPQDAKNLTDEEVARRWLVIYPPKNPKHFELRVEALLSDPERMGLLRSRIADLSWFMACLNGHIARRANREDDCTGRFWEGRFHSSRPMESLDHVYACMTYVDLNPLRAGVSMEVAEEGDYTAVRRRVEESHSDGGKLGEVLAPLRLDRKTGRIFTEAPTSLTVGLATYLEHLEWTARSEAEKHAGRSAIRLEAPRTLRNPEAFLKLVRRYYRRWGRKMGPREKPPIEHRSHQNAEGEARVGT